MMNIRANTDRHTASLQWLSSIPTEARATTEAENEAIRQKVAHQSAWLRGRLYWKALGVEK